MSAHRAVSFACPDCKEKVFVEFAVVQNNDVSLMGTCNKCGHGFRFMLDQVYSSLFEAPIPPGNGRKQ